MNVTTTSTVAGEDGDDVGVFPAADVMAVREHKRSFFASTNSARATCLMLADIVLICACFFIVSLARGPSFIGESPWFFIFIPVGAVLFVTYLIDGYRSTTDFLSAHFAVQYLLALAVAVLITLFAPFVVFPTWKPGILGRTNILFSFGSFALIAWLMRRYLCRYFIRTVKETVILFIGTAECGRQFYRDYCNRFGAGRVIFSSSQSNGSSADTKVTESDRMLLLNEKTLRSLSDQVDVLVCSEPIEHYPRSLLREIINLRLRSIPVYSLESFYASRLRKIPLSMVGPQWLFEEGFSIVHEPIYAHLKRLFDVTASFCALLLLSPLLLLVAALVKWTSPGPVLFRQMRIGLNGKKIEIIKFRTMVVGSEHGSLYTEADDQRITPVGAILRKLRLDELPQLWNVLKDDMSLIGPRAEWDKLVASYEQQIPYYHFRHLVKPGITGWAQVNYPYGANLEDTRKKLEYDLYYIRHYSFTIDASIVFKTLNIILFGKGR